MSLGRRSQRKHKYAHRHILISRADSLAGYFHAELNLFAALPKKTRLSCVDEGNLTGRLAEVIVAVFVSVRERHLLGYLVILLTGMWS